MSASDTDSTAARPLTKRKKETSELYRRRPEVERQIERVHSLPSVRVFESFQTQNRSEADYLFDEAIVYLLREMRAKGDKGEIESLYPELNRRIWRLLSRFRSSFSSQADFEDFGQKVETSVVTKIFKLDSDSADYAQVNFGDFVVTEAKSAWRGRLIALNREIAFSPPERDGEDDAPDAMEQIGCGGTTPEDRLVMKEAINRLPPHMKKVAALLADGWKVESKNDGEPTIAKQLGVSSRTIRNWLNEARELLDGYKGELSR